MKAPIGVFDSGLGGLTVLQALRGQLPSEDFLYFADTRFLPYGERSETFLRERGVAIAQGLVARGAKALVIACNTATAAAAEVIRAAVGVPVVAIEPAVKPAVAMSRHGAVAVLATPRTLASPRFQRLVDDHGGKVEVIAIACPGLADAIENDGADSPAVARLLDEFVMPLAETSIDVVVLGCTHYPWVREGIAARLPNVSIIDTGEAVARQLVRRLHAENLLGGGHGQMLFTTSGTPAAMRVTVNRLWGAHLHVNHWEP